MLISDYLYAKASQKKVPLSITFEISPVCNFACKMCYVRRTPAAIAAEGKRVREWTEWLEIAKQFRRMGSLFLLLTGGEPFLYPHFRELYTQLHQMGFIVAINSNGTMIDEETVEWLKEMAPSRVNITLYGGSPETYQRICGQASGYHRAVRAIELLKAAGIPVVINASMIPENAADLEYIAQFGKDRDINTRIATYMFPPIRREQEESDSRFTPGQAAELAVKKFRIQLSQEKYQSLCRDAYTCHQRALEEGTWGENGSEGMRCRAGRSACWISWDGKMTACGLMEFPLITYPFQRSVRECWDELTEKVRECRVLNQCANCPKSEICGVCAAMLMAEEGDVNRRSDYLCQMTDGIINQLKEDYYEPTASEHTTEEERAGKEK